MKKWKYIILLGCIIFFASQHSFAQCSVCTKTAEQLGEKPGKGLNAGILYLMTTPLIALAYIGYRWFKREKSFNENA